MDNIRQLVGKDEEKLIKLFESVEQELIRDIEKTDFTKRDRKLRLLAQVRDKLSSLEEPTAEYIMKYSDEYYTSGVDEVDKALEKISTRGSFELVDPLVTEFVISNVEDIQDQLINDVRNTLNFSYTNLANSINTAVIEVKREIAQTLKKDIVEGIAKSQILGESRQKISNKIVQKLKENGITAMTYPSEAAKSGQANLSLQAYAKSIARQTLINSRNSGVIAEATRRGHDLLRISSHANPSPMCEPWGGKIVSISGTDTRYPSLDQALFKGNYKAGGGILWRWCRHFLSVYIETNIEFR